MSDIDPIDPTGAFAKARFDKKWLKAEDGDTDAQYDLGCDYMSGTKFVEKDLTKADEWLSKATAQGHKPSLVKKKELMRILEREGKIMERENGKEDPDSDLRGEKCEKCGTVNYHKWYRHAPSHCSNCGAELDSDYMPPDDGCPDEWA